MPNFKPKAKKKIKMDKNTLITLDNKHNEKMNSFQQIEEDIVPALKQQKEELVKHSNLRKHQNGKKLLLH